MKIYLVGGAVRDILMNLHPHDFDFVVVGSSKKEMIESGFTQVGADFPVFIHPTTNMEYALARTEKKTGEGYTGFETNFDPSVTLEEDLKRRDLSINSIAFNSPQGEVHRLFIDPFNGKRDIENKILRATSEAFAEDPLRVYRLARFSAKFPDFSVDSGTIEMCRKMIQLDEFKNLTSERIGQELLKALNEKQPSKFFWFLREIGALHIHMKEVNDLIGQTQPEKWHPEGDSFVHTMEVLDRTSEGNLKPIVRFSALVHDFGKGITPKDKLPHHYGHEGAGVKLVENFSDRLRLPVSFKKIGMKVAKFHMHVHKTKELNPKTFVKVFDAFRGNIKDLQILTEVSKFDARGRGEKSRNNPYNQAPFFLGIMLSIKSAKIGERFTLDELKTMKPNRIKNEFNELKVHAAQKEKNNLYS